MNKYKLSDYFESSLIPDHLVILKVDYQAVIGVEIEIISGVIELIVCRNHMFIEKLARNTLIARGRVGFWLVNLAEGITRALNLGKVQLLSLEESYQWYVDLGYEEYSHHRNDPEFGVLIPMQKVLNGLVRL